MERLWVDSNAAGSYSPFTCLVESNLLFECLDIASARTLGDSVMDIYSGTVTVPEADGVIQMNQTDALFGGDVACDGKRVGDGVVNVYDMSTLLWYQFSSSPYDTLPRDPSVVSTVNGRTGTGARCDKESSRQEWLLTVGEDYCATQASATFSSKSWRSGLSAAPPQTTTA